MDNFDLKKYLAEGKLLKEAFYPEFEGETNDKINDIAIAVVDELESKLDSESSGILKGMDYYVGSDGMDNDEVEQGFTKWFIDLVKYLSKNNNEVTISSVEQDGKVFTPAITLKYLDNGKEDISWKLKRDLAEGKLLKEDITKLRGQELLDFFSFTKYMNVDVEELESEFEDAINYGQFTDPANVEQDKKDFTYENGDRFLDTNEDKMSEYLGFEIDTSRMIDDYTMGDPMGVEFVHSDEDFERWMDEGGSFWD